MNRTPAHHSFPRTLAWVLLVSIYPEEVGHTVTARHNITKWHADTGIWWNSREAERGDHGKKKTTLDKVCTSAALCVRALPSLHDDAGSLDLMQKLSENRDWACQGSWKVSRDPGKEGRGELKEASTSVTTSCPNHWLTPELCTPRGDSEVCNFVLKELSTYSRYLLQRKQKGSCFLEQG